MKFIAGNFGNALDEKQNNIFFADSSILETTSLKDVDKKKPKFGTRTTSNMDMWTNPEKSPLLKDKEARSGNDGVANYSKEKSKIDKILSDKPFDEKTTNESSDKTCGESPKDATQENRAKSIADRTNKDNFGDTTTVTINKSQSTISRLLNSNVNTEKNNDNDVRTPLRHISITEPVLPVETENKYIKLF